MPTDKSRWEELEGNKIPLPSLCWSLSSFLFHFMSPFILLFIRFLLLSFHKSSLLSFPFFSSILLFSSIHTFSSSLLFLLLSFPYPPFHLFPLSFLLHFMSPPSSFPSSIPITEQPTIFHHSQLFIDASTTPHLQIPPIISNYSIITPRLFCSPLLSHSSIIVVHFPFFLLPQLFPFS